MFLTFTGGDSDGDIFDSPSVACHGMSFKVGQHDIVIIIGKIGSYIVFCQIISTSNRQRHRTVFIHNIHIGNLCISMVLRNLIVHGGAGSGTPIGRVALYDGRVFKGLDKGSDQIRTKIVAARLTDRKLYSGIFPGGKPPSPRKPPSVPGG